MDVTSLTIVLLLLSVGSSHNARHTLDRFSQPSNDVRFQQDNQIIRQYSGSSADTVTYREHTAAAKDLLEPGDDSWSTIKLWHETPPELNIEPIDIKSSKQHEIPTLDLCILQEEVFSDRSNVSHPAGIRTVEANQRVCDIKQSQQGDIEANCSRRGLESVPTHLPSDINRLDLSHNLLSYLANNTFNIFSNLTHLNLNFNKISQVNIQSFAGLFKLTTLFVTGNSPTYNRTSVPPGMFYDVNNLEKVVNRYLARTIILANNEGDTVSTFQKLNGLKHLDLSNNLIAEIDKSFRDILDQAHRENNLTISVQGNPFLCDCANVDFTVWLVETKVVQDTNKTFPCMKENGTMTNAKDIADKYYIENKRCNGKLNLALAVILLIVLIMSIVITYFVGRNPTRVRNLIMKVIGYGVRFLSPSDFEFTLYVGYCQEDIPFVFRNLRLALERGRTRVFLHDRDVLPGVPIANGIIEGVTRSWKVLLVISQDFLDDPWSDFMISSAVYGMTDLIPDRILVTLVGGVQVEELPEVLLNAVDEEFILCADQFQGNQLWVRLKEVANIDQL